MASSPHATDLVPDAELESLVRGICKRPGMYVGEPRTLTAVCAYLQGFDAANWHAPLVGLHQWLVLRINGCDNIAWSANAERLMKEGAPPSSEEAAIAALGDLLIQFIEYRRANGLTKIFYDYGKWQLRRSWYDGPLRSGAASRSRRNDKTG